MTFLQRKNDQLALAHSVLTGYTLLTIGILIRLTAALFFRRFLWWL